MSIIKQLILRNFLHNKSVLLYFAIRRENMHM